MKGAGQHAAAEGGGEAAHRRRPRPRLPWWLAALLLPTAAVLLVCVRDAAAWVGRPFAGFLFSDRGIVFSIGRSAWRDPQLRRVEWARVTSIDGVPVETGDAVHAAVTAAGVGRPLTFSFTRGPEVFRLVVSPRTFTRDDFLVVFAPMLGVGIWIIGVWAALVIARPDVPEIRAAFGFGLPLGLVLVTGPDQYGPYRLTWLFFLSLAILPPSVVGLAADFLWPHRRWVRRAVAAIYVVFAVLGGGLVAWRAEPAVFLPLLYIVYCALANALLLYMGVLASALVSGQRFRPQVALLLSAALLPAGIAIAVLVTYPLSTEPISVPWLILPMGIWPVLHGIAHVMLAQPQAGVGAPRCARG